VIQTSQPYPCKGAPGQRCTHTVKYTWRPVYGLVKGHDNLAGQSKVAYLTCEVGHTNPYTINKDGQICG
jgi:hypothetical protein